MTPNEAVAQILNQIFQNVNDAITSFISSDALILISAIISILLIIKGYHFIKHIMMDVDRRDDNQPDDDGEGEYKLKGNL